MRQRIAAMIAGVTVAAAVVTLTPGVAQAATHGWWHTAGFTVANTGFNPYEPGITPATVSRLQPGRTMNADGEYQFAPVLDDGRIYVPDSDGVSTYDEVTGARLWRWNASEETSSGRVVTGLVVLDEQMVVSVDVRSGGGSSARIEVLASATGVVTRTIHHDGAARTLLVDKGVVFVSSHGSDRWGLTSGAYRLSDGVGLWTDPAMWTPHPVSANGKVLIHGLSGSKIRDLATGAVVWESASTFEALAANEAGTKFFVAWGHSLQLLDATTGALTWLASDVYASYASVSPTRVYVTTRQNKVLAFNAATGAPAFWTKSYTGRLGKPVIAGGVLYVTLPENRVYALNPVTGAELTTQPFAGAVDPPVVTNGTVYVTNGSVLYTYTL